MIRKRIIYNILAFLGIGVTIGLFLKIYKMLSFNYEVSIFEVFALVVTVILAWWVAEKLEKDSDKERCEKDIIIEKLKSMDGLVEKLTNEISDEDLVTLTSVTSIIGSIDAHSLRITEQIKAHYPTVLNQNVDYSAELNLLDDLCTNDEDGGMECVIDGGLSVCQYTSERKEEIGSCANLLSDKIFNLEILVNRA